ncbi:COG4223 family protein [Seohaeicola zhoushanensis]|uniref:Mitochondrial inner membrane protein n=1 Tax=Seohaeicola zhoushanensis TaxID=1569283 RepID=A0A8J3GUH3_9RHOB|nr:hypothetical protein [Seohaeicola zhoushanensis]GHF35496.1 hypothetical protein GCM10017056_03850 [Seohaeicola zhoushanensis]
MASDPKSESEIDGDPISASEPAAAETETETPLEETVETPEPPAEQPEAIPEPVASSQPEPRRGGFGPALLGGVVAAALGLVAGKAGIIDPLLPPSWREADYTAQIDKLESTLANQAGEMGALREQVVAIKMPDTGPLSKQIEALSGAVTPLGGQLSELTSAVSALEARIDALEKRPISEGVSQSAIDAYERELTRMREALAEQRAEVDNYIAQARSMEAEAGQSRQLAAQRNALTRLQTALIGGEPYAEVLGDLRDAGLDVPAPLADSAETGVTTLAALRAGFPEAAREALAAAREATRKQDAGFSAFLARQFGARSVEPRAGDDPDAVLSRAEAAVTDGRIDTALQELDTLPDVAKAQMAGWIAEASRRQAAMGAADALSQSLASK